MIPKIAHVCLETCMVSNMMVFAKDFIVRSKEEVKEDLQQSGLFVSLELRGILEAISVISRKPVRLTALVELAMLCQRSVE